MKNNRTVLNRTQKIEKLHWHIQHWKSDLQFMEDEILFIERLMNSYIFTGFPIGKKGSSENRGHQQGSYRILSQKARTGRSGLGRSLRELFPCA